jgi:hypothetical protein
MTLRVLAVAATLVMLPNADGWTDEAPPSSAPPSPVSRMPEVTVTARRHELEQRVFKFVNQIAAQENEGEAGLVRWQAPPVCPLVSGLPEQEGEFILGRVSEIARVAGVPLAGEQCRPNLYILVTPQPEDLLRGMEKRDRRFTFGWDPSSRTDTPAGVVDEFIRTPRAVRAWYNTDGKDSWGNHLRYCPRSSITCDGYYGWVSGCTPPPPPDPTSAYLCNTATAGGTHLEFDTVWTFSRVFVIVDERRLQGVTRGQLADYVAMVGFGKLKPGARLADAPTILKLFDTAPQAAPAGLTDWDQAFLKNLYATDQRSKQQRGEIARSMVRTLAP